MEADSSNLFLSCGEDAVVYEIDLREEQVHKIATVKNSRDTKVPLYSVSSNSRNTYEFCVAGKDQYVRFYDKRMLAKERSKVMKKLCPTKYVIIGKILIEKNEF